MSEIKQHVFSDYVSPELEDNIGQKFVLWGDNNSYWEHINNLYLNSPTNYACLDGLYLLCYGKGLRFANPEDQRRFNAVFRTEDVKKSLLQYVVSNKVILWCKRFEISGDNLVLSRVYHCEGERVGMGKKDEHDEIKNYWYSSDWQNRTRAGCKPKEYPAFEKGAYDLFSILYAQAAHSMDGYFGPVAYQGGLQYAETEVELSNFHLNYILRGFNPGAMIKVYGHFTDDQKRQFVNNLRATKTGTSNAGKMIVEFLETPEDKIEIDRLEIPDAHRQFEYIDKESRNKLLLVHKITSPLLLGIREGGNGLSGNTAEIIEAYKLLRTMVIEPKRNDFIDAIEPILAELGLPRPDFEDFDLFTSAPAPAANTTMSAASKNRMSDEQELEWIEYLKTKGEKITDEDDEWMLVDEEVAGSAADEKDVVDALMKRFATELPDPGEPQERSPMGDSGLFKIRYAYAPMVVKDKSREFCKFMVAQTQAGMVYRYEDIIDMGNEGVNGQFSPRGASTYNIFEWKGGVYCHHYWTRRVYFRKRASNGQFLPASQTPALENDKRVSVESARNQVRPEVLRPPGWDLAKTKPNNTPTRGKLN